MLTNSYSYLPVFSAAGSWSLVSDASVARFLCAESGEGRKTRLAKTLLEAYSEDADILQPAVRLPPDAAVADALAHMRNHYMVLVEENKNGDSPGRDGLLGILTAFDLL
jgi:hypothetical protein